MKLLSIFIPARWVYMSVTDKHMLHADRHVQRPRHRLHEVSQ